MLRSLPTAALACLLACVLLTPVGEAAAAGIHSTATASQRVTFRNQTGIQPSLATTTPYDFGPISPLAAANPAGNENRATVWSNGTWRLPGASGRPRLRTEPHRYRHHPRRQAAARRHHRHPALDHRQVNINYQLTLRWPDPANAPGSSYAQTLVYTAVTP